MINGQCMIDAILISGYEPSVLCLHDCSIKHDRPDTRPGNLCDVRIMEPRYCTAPPAASA
jgi:hypothetical protein